MSPQVEPPAVDRGGNKIITGVIVLALLYIASSAVASLAMQKGWFGGPAALQATAAPEFTLPDVTGKPHSLADYRGRWVLLDFWATWCQPCARQTIHMQNALSEWPHAKELTVLPVNTDKQDAERMMKVRAYMRQLKVRDTVLLDDATMSTKAAYQAESIPTLVLIDPKGQVVYARGGVHDAAELRNILEEHLH